MATLAAPRPYAVAARELLRNTLLDAAREELRDRPWGEITMADVATRAGISRQTLYKEFSSRDEFAQAFVLREADRFVVAVEQAIQARLEDPIEAVTAAFDVFLSAAAEDPFVRAVVFDDGLLPLVTTQGEPLVERAASRIAAIIRAGWPSVRREDAELLGECLVRLAISYAALPKGPASMTAASISRLLGPFIERAVARGA